ncbi:MAG TPA: tetratricopeptide repeat protein [Anaerolineales bacterium]|nr:tetratricopeptide repeat protein [Anaerolineales bacterium]
MMLESAPPAPRLPARPPGRLTPFIGRQSDAARLTDLLEDPNVRLITICGMGGIGKTALALQLLPRVEHEFEDGTALIRLAPLESVEELLPALASAFDVQLPPNGELQQAVLDHLAGLQMLLVLDSFEHLLEEAVLVRDMLLAAPRLKIIVTSREKLNLEAETVYLLDGLDVPFAEDVRGLSESDSVRLFVQRARQVRPDFALDASTTPAIVQLCRMLEGNPLGILLAAAWVEHFSPDEIAAQAERSFDFLTRNLRDVEPRHSCLRAVFESSFDRLDKTQKAIFRRLSVFRGGFDLPAAQAVAGADLVSLITLVEKSMLTRVPEKGRYELHGVLQQYARERLLSAGEEDSTLAVHTAYYAAFVQTREQRLISGLQGGTLDEIQADLDNIRQAWTCIVRQRDFDPARLMMPGIYAFCDMRSRFYDGEAIFRQAVEGLAPQAEEEPHGAWALALLSWYDLRTYIEHLDSYEEIASQASRCLEQARTVHDAQAEAACLALLSSMAYHQRDFKAAIRHAEAAMRACPDLDGVYWLTMRIGLGYQSDGQYEKAIRAYQLGIRRGRETGEKVKLGWALLNTGDTLILQGKAAEAEAYLQESLSQFRQVGTHVGVIWSLYSLSRVSMALGRRDRARELAQEARELAGRIHSAVWLRMTGELLQGLDPEQRPAPNPAAQQAAEPLSERELEVLHLLDSDMTGPEMARALVVSLNTIRFHTKHIYQKLGVSSRIEAIHRAKELGL